VSRRNSFAFSTLKNSPPPDPPLSRAEVLQIAERALRRSSSELHLELKRGLSGLASVASTAPLVGLLGTVIGIHDAFKGCGAQKWYCTMMVLEGVCEALATTVLGLLVAVPAVWLYNFFSTRLEVFDIEMELASLELMNYFLLFPARHLSPGCRKLAGFLRDLPANSGEPTRI
jgi:biopolymer transport protein ExbB/TolQ